MSASTTTHVRYLIVLLVVASTFSYVDRVVLSITAVGAEGNA